MTPEPMKPTYTILVMSCAALIVAGVSIQTKQPGMTLIVTGVLGLLVILTHAIENSRK